METNSNVEALSRLNSGMVFLKRDENRKYVVSCRECGHIVARTAQNLHRPCGQCSGKVGFKKEQLSARCHSDIEYVGYLGKSQHLVRCKNCNEEFKRTANHLKNQCPLCRSDWKNSLKTSDQEIIEKCHPNIEFIKRLDGKKNSKSILVRCSKCNVERTRSPGSLHQACQCFAKFYESKAETEIKEWIESLGIKTEKLKIQYNGKSTREVDIYIPALNLAIEYNGLYWHGENTIAKKFFKTKFDELTTEQKGFIYKYHIEKTKLFAQKGIQLIHIWEHEWLERKEQVKNFVYSKLRLSQSVGARKCEFKEVPTKDARVFCEQNHIQGPPAGIQYASGAYYNNELIMVATFSKHHRQRDEIVLNRLCAKFGWHISGGLSKMSKLAAKHFGRDIKTWVHKTLSNAESYVKSGWKIVDEVPPDYFYQKNQKAYSKQSFKKDNIKIKFPEVYDKNKTEKQMTVEIGLQRVWDCGKYTLIYEDI